MKKSFFSLMLALAVGAGSAVAQTTTSGDIAGTLTDQTGAAIPGATVTVTNVLTGESKTATSSTTGSYRIATLSPGSYKVSASAPNFATTQNMATVAVGTIVTDDLKLTIGASTTTVEVSGAASIVNTTNADVTTTFTSQEVQAMPNPGNDLTYVAQTAPGTVMNTGTTAGGYGNFSSFGISGLSNVFTLDGGYENDPFLNTNNTGASNLQLGNNEVDTVTVTAPAYSAQFGGLGGAQVTEITTGGGNRVHGNLSYYWDGRALNANDWFNKQNQVFYGEKNEPAFVNANQYAASIGGPLVHDKLFWFVNTEGIRATTPAAGQVYVPNAAFQNCALGNDPGGTVTVAGDMALYNADFKTNYQTDQPLTYTSCASLNTAADTEAVNAYNGTGNPNATNVGYLGDGIQFGAAAPSQQALLKTIFNTYNNSPYRPAASAISQDPNDPSADTYYATSATNLTEWLLTARVDYRIGDNDSMYVHYRQDQGLQPTWTDLIDPRFSTLSNQPQREGQLNETHNFTPNFVNQLVLAGTYYSAVFQNTNNYSPVAPSTILFQSGDMGNFGPYYGGDDYAFPQGRRVAGYQIIDDVSYTRGRNTIRWGFNMRRDNVTDVQGEETTSPASETTMEGFSKGVVDVEYVQRFPVRSTQPVSLYDMGAYVEDSYKLTPTLTMTAGLRLERNSNPTCHTDCFQVLSGPVGSLVSGANSATTAYNAATTGGGYIRAGRYRAFTGYQKFAAMPRVAFNWQATPKTTIRAGFGIFTDSFPGVVAEDLLSNAPTNYHALLYGTALGYSTDYNLDPSTSGSAYQAAVASNTAFQSGFTSGGNYNSVSAAVLTASGSPFSVPSFTTVAPSISYPTYDEYSLAIERSIDSKTSITVLYAGNRGYHEPVENGGINLSNSAAAPGFFAQVPAAKPVTAFATINNIYSGASSNYNGLVLSVTRRAKDLSVNFNYQFSKALDEISNGGFEPFAPDAGDAADVENPYDLHQQYGLADYNVTHNVTASFVYELPTIWRGMHNALGGFEFSGDVFHQSGLPYSVTQSASSFPGTAPGYGGTAGGFANGTIMLLARQTTNNFDHHCGGGTHVMLPDGSVPHPCDFKNAFVAPTNFGQQGRNTLIGPSYTDVNLGAFKTFGIPHYEGMRLKLGAQFFNFFNHPNFQNPSHGLTRSNSLGAIQGTVGAPTSILGSVGGADASPRLIQLHAALNF